ncbi:hypothetical protein BDV93DRAFT_528362 [Ceratobasidium sp. AG-I]|nr:hypothetical protein BDV93DRAFT_528362 [Ceratobasidium sp. AG-I]
MTPSKLNPIMESNTGIYLSHLRSERHNLNLIQNRLVAVPELLRMISGFLSRRDAFHLAQSSHACFQVAVEQIWSSISDPRPLLDLFPDFSEDSEDGTASDVSSATIPESFRFEFYASLVKRLDFSHDFFNRYTDDHLESLLSYTEKRTLLPKLQRLALGCDVVTDNLPWVIVFLSPSLLRIEGFSDYSGGLHINTAAEFFEHFAISCPAIKDLNIAAFIDQSQGHATRVPTLRAFSKLSSMRNLHSLCTNMEVFQPAILAVVGELPHLKTLKVLDDSYSSFYVTASVLPNDAFPALEKLWLPYFVIKELQVIWSIERLITRPTIVNIGLYDSGDECGGATFLANICQRSPQMVDLSFEYDGEQVLSRDYFRVFHHLSLEKLSLSGIKFDSLDAACKVISYACPLLHQLQLDDMEVSVLDLSHFAKLERLEKLKVSVNWTTCSELGEPVPESSILSPVFRQLEGGGYVKEAIEPELIMKTVMFLLSFWPELKPSPQLHKHSIEWLVNQCLRAKLATK